MPTTSSSIELRYAELAANLRACWAFERFFHRLARAQYRDGSPDPDPTLPASRRRLRSIAPNLASAPAEDLVARLDRVESDLRQSAARLSTQDSRVGAADLRRFVSRVRRLDEELAMGVLRFYLFSSRGVAWNAELVDKVDFLLSRLAEEISGPLLGRDLVRLEATLATLWSGAADEPVKATVAAAMRERVSGVHAQLITIGSLDELEASRVMPRYRSLKHGMGRLIVEPSVAMAVLEANALLGRTLQRLFGDEGWRIAAELRHLAELENGAGLSESLSLEIASLRRDLDRIESGRRLDDVRFSEVQRVRRVVEGLRPQLATAPSRRATSRVGPAALPRRGESEVAWELLNRLFEQLESLLAASGSLDEAEDILQDPGLPFGLERREIGAFLRLREHPGGALEADRLVLTGAALRWRLKTLLDGLEAGLGAAGAARADGLLDLTEATLEGFAAQVAAARRDADEVWAREAQFLRMLLLRDYATLWLELHAGRAARA